MINRHSSFLVFTILFGYNLATYTFEQHERRIQLQETNVDIDLGKVLSTTEDEFLSVCLCPFLKHNFPGRPWGTFQFDNKRVHTLLAGLAPAIIRFGGTGADWSVFYNVTSPDEQAEITKITTNLLPAPAYIVPFFPQDIDNLHKLARLANGTLLYDLNIQQRYGSQWDPTNTFLLLKYIQESGYAQDMDFELGNEPNYPELTISGTQIGNDVLRLKQLLQELKGFENARIVGPDIGVSTGGFLLKIAQDFAKTVKKKITAQTCHHYYFKGPGAYLSQFLDVNNFDSFEYNICTWRDALWNASKEQLDLWVGETSDSYNYGTPNVTNRYISGLLWLDKLGISARNQYKLVARQTFFGGYYPLISDNMYPNPDYWLSYVFKKLVGRKVLKVNGMKTKGQLVRVYAHCTSPRANYPPGSITVYVVNLMEGDPTALKFDPNIYGNFADMYEMLPHGGELLSQVVDLNGVPLKMTSDESLPKLRPVEFSLKSSAKITPLSYSFMVLKEANATICIS